VNFLADVNVANDRNGAHWHRSLLVPTPVSRGKWTGSSSDNEVAVSHSLSLPPLTQAIAPDWVLVNFSPYAVVHNLPLSKRQELFAKLDQEISNSW